MLVSLAFAVATLLSICAPLPALSASLAAPLLSDGVQEDNSLSPNAGLDFPPVRRMWVRISHPPPVKAWRTPNTALELECEALGSPPPTLRWLRDGAPITEEDDYENNAINEGSVNGMAKVKSRLIVNNILPSGRSVYTCLAQAGPKISRASSTVTTQGEIPETENPGEYLLLNQEVMSSPAKPRIVLFYSTVMDDIGTTLVIPCKVRGNPRPDIYWLDNDDVLIGGQNPRLKIMDSGELVIHGLRWSDMGGYTCVARNALSKDSITTFVYPVLNEN